MKRVRRIAVVVLAALVALLGAGALYVHLAGVPRYPVEKIELRVERTPERVARGKKLASMLCVGCHLDPGSGQLTGHAMVDVPTKFGKVYSSNITGHPQRGIGSWTDGEIAYLLRTGVARDGRYVPPWMIKLPHMADDDVEAIIAFLRSDDPLVAPADREAAGVSEASFLTKLLCRVAFAKLPYPARRIEAPPTADKVAYGRYLVTGLDCYGCHSAAWETMDIAHPERSAGYLGGGNPMEDQAGVRFASANLTFDEETGIGRWSEADLARALRDGFRPDRSALRSPMTPMPALTDDEVGAIYAYLRTVPKIRNPIPRGQSDGALPADASRGQRLYHKYSCVSCHGESGTLGGADLTRAGERFPTRDALATWIRDAPRIRPGTRMPGWRGIIAEDEYEPLVDHVFELGRRR